MKKSIKGILVAVISGLVMLCTLVSCDLTPSLQRYAVEFNKNCPKDFGDGWIVNKAEVIDDYLVFRSVADEENSIMALVLMDELGEEFTKQFTALFLEQEGMEKIYKACKKENKGIKMTLTGDKTGKTADLFNITPEEIQKMDL